MSFPRYPAYKDSGVEWLGQIPSHWSVAPLKSVVSCNDEVLVESTPEDFEIEYVEISGVDVGKGIVETSTLPFKAAASRARRIVRDGDVLVSTVRTYLRAIAPVRKPAPNLIASTGFAVLRPKQIDSAYLGYTCQAEHWISEVIARSAGVSYPAINASDLISLAIGLPPLVEQAAIAGFLDRETAKIDALVAEQEQLITLLKEKRQAVISHAVTKGLDPSVPMKDSGVEWLGEVPAHWSITALKRVCDVRDGTHETPQFLTLAEDTFPFVTTKDLVNGKVSFDEAKHISREDYDDFSQRSRVDIGDVLMPMIGSIGGAVLVDTNVPFAIKNIALFKRSDRFDPRWLTHFLNSDMSSVQFKLNRSGGVQGFVALGVLRDLCIPAPPKVEQIKIAETLSEAISKINLLMDLAGDAITTLQERRAALISAAVTGQIDVRGLAPAQELAA